MSELSRMLLVSGGNTTVVVNGLEQEGLVKRTTSTKDSRVVFVALTEKGLTDFEFIAAGHEAELDRLLSAFDEKAIESMVTLLKAAAVAPSE